VWSEAECFGIDVTEKLIRSFVETIKKELRMQRRQKLIQRFEQEAEVYIKAGYKLIERNIGPIYKANKFTVCDIWSVWDMPDNTGRVILKFPALYNEDADGWALKEICEIEGPLPPNCPLEYLDMTPQKNNPHFNEVWRRWVIEHWGGE
jgi:hypothetical protein